MKRGEKEETIRYMRKEVDLIMTRHLKMREYGP